MSPLRKGYGPARGEARRRRRSVALGLRRFSCLPRYRYNGLKRPQRAVFPWLDVPGGGISIAWHSYNGDEHEQAQASLRTRHRCRAARPRRLRDLGGRQLVLRRRRRYRQGEEGYLQRALAQGDERQCLDRGWRGGPHRHRENEGRAHEGLHGGGQGGGREASEERTEGGVTNAGA